MFNKILIANRGEIALRVMRTARRLGVRTVAVYSTADERALHVEQADEAICIGPAPASESYLRGEVILDAARASGAEAIHPGYGFLSENARFAQSCEAAGIRFIGPPAEAIRIMGSKAESKRVLTEAAVPMVPGYHGAEQDLATLTREAERIGFPVLVKASSGGGGKGMRVVRTADALADALAGAKRESLAAFGDEQLLLEKYLTASRHVEIQVFADTHGKTIYLFERDCSLQRRHQKVIEEAPAPNLSAETRRRMGEAAVAAARAVNYAGAGTVEFLYAAGAFYFIEMNTRLQVEHPVTEMITGLDLVEWQLRVHAGEPLPIAQDELFAHGHAFEARLYAEDPERDFLPAAGRLLHLTAPAASEHVRVDTGVRAGDEIGTFYDPMIAKLIVWDEDRAGALRQLRRALEAYAVVGVTTNLGFLQRIARHPAFEQAAIDTDFIARYRTDLTIDVSVPPERVLAFGAITLLLRELEARRSASAYPMSPWRSITGWQLNQDYYQDLGLWHGEVLRRLRVRFSADGYDIGLPSGASIRIRDAVLADSTLTVIQDGIKRCATVVAVAERVCVLFEGTSWWLERDDPVARATLADTGSGHLRAPMPGKVIALLVESGQQVEANQPVMILEAMKMEHTIVAPAAGEVIEVRFAQGDRVAEGDELLAIELLARAPG